MLVAVSGILWAIEWRGEEHYLHCCGGSPSGVTGPQCNPEAALCKKSTAHCYRRLVDGGALCLELPFCLFGYRGAMQENTKIVVLL